MRAHSLRTSPLCSRTSGALESPHNTAQGLTNLRRIRQPKRRGFGDFGVALRGVNRIVSRDSSMCRQLHTHHSVYVRVQFADDTILHELQALQIGFWESVYGFILARLAASASNFLAVPSDLVDLVPVLQGPVLPEETLVPVCRHT